MTIARLEPLCEHDFYAWTRAQARQLRRFARRRPILPSIAEEIADFGKRQHDSLSRPRGDRRLQAGRPDRRD
jgi:hypothetical protein